MRIDLIENIEQFNSARKSWEAVYDADPEGQFFLSWAWMAHWLEMLEGPWFILAARKTSDAKEYVGFLPLRLRTRFRKGEGFYSELNMAGRSAADYTGLLCRPEDQHLVIPAFARFLKALKWATIDLENLCISDDRLRMFMAHFPERTFSIQHQERVNQADNVNNLICPRINLPSDWEGYLGFLSANTRQRIRRFMRAFENDGNFTITSATGETIERDLKTLLDLWQTKWGARKGQRLGGILRSNHKMLLRSFNSGLLHLPVLWHDSKPVCAFANFIDLQKRSLFFYMAGRDQSFTGPPPGTILHAHCIRYAIAQGFKVYDFLRGDEDYKFSLGAEERRIKCIVLGRKSERIVTGALDVRSVPYVLAQTTKLHKNGDLGNAERGYMQVLDANPQEPTALYCLAQLRETKGDHKAAARLYRALTLAMPSNAKAWLRLGKSLYGQRRFDEAVMAYRELIKLAPDLSPAYIGLGNSLMRKGLVEAAIAAFETARDLNPQNEDLQHRLQHLIVRKAGNRQAAVAQTIH